MSKENGQGPLTEESKQSAEFTQYVNHVDSVTKMQREEIKKHRTRMESLGYTFDKFGTMTHLKDK